MASQASQPDNRLITYTPRYVDIGINLSDPIFRGCYHGHQKHPDDLAGVVDRARQVGCAKLIITGSDIKSSLDALKLSQEYPGTCYATAGIHPCSSAIFGSPDINSNSSNSEHTTPCEADPHAPMPESHLPDPESSAKAIEQLTSLVSEAQATPSAPHRLVALGEFGLDYDRLNYCNAAIQRHSFAAQLQFAASLQRPLPLFLHSRAAHVDFVRLLKDAFGKDLERLERGAVVHSFTGTLDELNELMDLGLYIGINGCSFKTVDNCEVVRAVRLDRIMLETDGPWCEVRPSHEGFKYLLEKKEVQMAVQDGAATELATGVDGLRVEEEDSKKARNKTVVKKKNQKKEPLIQERFKVVKKEKWEEGAMVKGRNEPCTIERVATIVAALKGMSVEQVCEAAWRNSIEVFGLD
ncbi:hypothetical protein E4U35_000664 [Claviceps purpurea]|nr:hypothetical protein E4U35_000664 [Claviceps purpurea]KAG6270380.1 hypothetical protein E4U49_005547 [Claviceps purpurea]KAG6302576.1 hypothetical protein E4U45_002702 [Claviceps purpurea]